jgi:hypothetical protein
MAEAADEGHTVRTWLRRWQTGDDTFTARARNAQSARPPGKSNGFRFTA